MTTLQEAQQAVAHSTQHAVDVHVEQARLVTLAQGGVAEAMRARTVAQAQQHLDDTIAAAAEADRAAIEAVKRAQLNLAEVLRATGVR